MWPTILLDLLKAFAKHWFRNLVILLFIALGITVYIQHQEVKNRNTTIAAQAKTIKGYAPIIAGWVKDDKDLRAIILAQTNSILNLQKAGEAYDAQIKAAQHQAAIAESQYQTELNYEKNHPAPVDCAGAMNYLLQQAITPPGGSK